MTNKKFSKFPPKKIENNIIKPREKHNWSEYQKDLFKEISRGTGHIIVEAYAGSAKTTSIVEGFRYIPKGKKSIALAFNKSIAEELRSRAPSFVETFTFHALGLRAIKQRFGNIEIDDNKVYNIIKSKLDISNHDLIMSMCETIAYCKYGLIDTPSAIEGLIDKFSIDLCDVEKPEYIKNIIKTLGLSKAITNVIDFNDMCWMPFIYNLSVGQYDFVALDERQDLNRAQLVMAKKACKPDGRIVAVGDENQALYSWRLADTSIIKEIRDDVKTKILPLPISYRCPQKIIDLAKNWVPDITCPATAIDGEINDISLNELYDLVKPGCFILSRTNAPLIKICMALIKRNIKANIRGRDVGNQLNYLIKKSKKKQIPAFIKWLDSWKDDEVKKLKAKNINTDNILDRHECLINLCEDLNSLEEVSKKINDMFNDTEESNIVILSTVHRAKGLERDDVFVLRWTFRLWLDNLVGIEKPNEEANIRLCGGYKSAQKIICCK